MLKNMGIAAWVGCILVIVYQAVTWFFTANWPSITLLDGLNRLGFEMTAHLDTLPADVTLKAAYVLVTTELSVALWWLGVGFLVLAAMVNILFRK